MNTDVRYFFLLFPISSPMYMWSVVDDLHTNLLIHLSCGGGSVTGCAH